MLFRIVVLLSVLFLIHPPSSERGIVTSDRSMVSRILDKDVEYTLYLPPGFGQSEQLYPVVYLMHGANGGRHRDWFDYGGADRIFDRLIARGEVPPFIAVAPDARRDNDDLLNTYYMNDADGGFRWQDMFIREFVPHIESRLPIMAKKGSRGMMGLSMGGYAAVAYALKYPELLASAASMSGAFRTERQVVEMDQGAYEWRFGKAWGMGLEGRDRLNEAYRANSVFTILDQSRASTVVPAALYLDCGADDPLLAGNSKLRDALSTLGVGHRFVVRDGAHDWDYWRSGIEEATRFVAGGFHR